MQEDVTSALLGLSRKGNGPVLVITQVCKKQEATSKACRAKRATTQITCCAADLTKAKSTSGGSVSVLEHKNDAVPIVMHTSALPAKQSRSDSTSLGSSMKRSSTPGRARSCCTFLEPASWYATEGHKAALQRSSRSLHPAAALPVHSRLSLYFTASSITMSRHQLNKYNKVDENTSPCLLGSSSASIPFRQPQKWLSAVQSQRQDQSVEQ